MEKIIKILKQEKAIILIFFATLILRLFFLSPWLEDWDSVQFALALQDFDITRHQPHPPGYPLYIVVGRIFNFFWQNDTLALISLSALLGSLAVFPLYLLAKKIFNRKVATLSSIFFVLTPISWMMSEVALTNIPGLFLLVVFVYFLYTWRDKPQKLILVSGFGGFILGFRFTELPIMAALLLLVYLKLRNLKFAVYSLLAFVLGLSLWVIPTVLDTGLKNFFAGYSWIANYVLRHDTLQGGISFSLALFAARLRDLWYILKIGYTPSFLLLSGLSLFWIYTKLQNWQKFHLQFLFVWFLAYALPSVFFYNLEVPRYTLPYAIPFAILSAYFSTSLVKFKILTIPIFLVTSALLLNQSWSQVARFKNTTPPTIAPVLYVKENFKPQDTILLTSFTYRQFQYYAPQFPNFYVDKVSDFDPEGKMVIIDQLGIKERFPALADFKITDRRQFSGDADIFARVPEVNLYVLTLPK